MRVQVTGRPCRYSLRRAAGGHVSTAARRIDSLFYTAAVQPSRARPVDPSYSRGSLLLGAGSHSIRIQALRSPFGGGSAYLKAIRKPGHWSEWDVAERER